MRLRWRESALTVSMRFSSTGPGSGQPSPQGRERSLSSHAGGGPRATKELSAPRAASSAKSAGGREVESGVPGRSSRSAAAVAALNHRNQCRSTEEPSG